jgi:hypothetical protein
LRHPHDRRPLDGDQLTPDPHAISYEFVEPDGKRRVVLDDDGSVAYAYLFEDEKIVGDVWLYNVGETPEEIDWGNRDALPFPNPKPYSADLSIKRLRDIEARCFWTDRGADITFDGVLFARLERGAMPGWSLNARVDGRLARVLCAAEEQHE